MHFTIRPWCPSPFHITARMTYGNNCCTSRQKAVDPATLVLTFPAHPTGKCQGLLNKAKMNCMKFMFTSCYYCVCDTCGCACADVNIGVRDNCAQLLLSFFLHTASRQQAGHQTCAAHTFYPLRPPDGTKLNSLAHPSQFSEKQHADSISADGSVTNRKALMKSCEQSSDTFHKRPSFPGKDSQTNQVLRSQVFGRHFLKNAVSSFE